MFACAQFAPWYRVKESREDQFGFSQISFDNGLFFLLSSVLANEKIRCEMIGVIPAETKL